VSTVPPPGGSQPQIAGYTPATTQTNSLAVISLVTGVGSFLGHVIPFIGGGTLALVAIVTGFIARSQIKRTGEQGAWMANVGIVIGILHLAGLFVLLLVFLFVVFVLGVALWGAAAHGGSAPTATPIPPG